VQQDAEIQYYSRDNTKLPLLPAADHIKRYFVLVLLMQNLECLCYQVTKVSLVSLQEFQGGNSYSLIYCKI
jgi:hypothetical protein